LKYFSFTAALVGCVGLLRTFGDPDIKTMICLSNRGTVTNLNWMTSNKTE